MIYLIAFALVGLVLTHIVSLYDTATMIKTIEPDTELSRSVEFIYNMGRKFAK